jgi:hypothetical protein
MTICFAWTVWLLHGFVNKERAQKTAVHVFDSGSLSCTAERMSKSNILHEKKIAFYVLAFPVTEKVSFFFCEFVVTINYNIILL